MIYEETESFKKDFKRLSKKFKTLDKDFELVKKATIELFHINNINNNSIFLCEGQQSELLKDKVKMKIESWLWSI